MEGYSSRPFEKSEDGTFVLVSQVDLMNPTDIHLQNVDLGLEEKESIVVDWNIWNLVGYCWDQWGNQGEYMSPGRVDGEWHLRFPVTIDRSVNEAFDINKKENGITVRHGIKTKAGLVLEVELPDFRQEPYHDPYNDPDIGICDSEGNFLQWMNQKSDLHEDGTSVMQIMVLYDGQKELSFKATNKNNDGSLIADIGFEVP